jgi:short-subunit dehydrogenase involved in D-alanine esterification of teichoic acids
MQLTGNTILITGGTSGIGRSLAGKLVSPAQALPLIGGRLFSLAVGPL